MGDFPSGPPPVGRTVVLIAVRVFTGSEGYSRSAIPFPRWLAAGTGRVDCALTLFQDVLEIVHFSQDFPTQMVGAVAYGSYFYP